MVHGHPVTVVDDPGMEPIVVNLLRAHGARVDLVTEPDPVGGWQEARRRRVADLLADEPGAWNPNQYSSRDNVSAYRALALELHEQLGTVDGLVCSDRQHNVANCSIVHFSVNPGREFTHKGCWL